MTPKIVNRGDGQPKAEEKEHFSQGFPIDAIVHYFGQRFIIVWLFGGTVTSLAWHYRAVRAKSWQIHY